MRSIRTIAPWPISTAHMMGVCQDRGGHGVLPRASMLTSPVLSSMSNICRWPAFAAKCSELMPSLVRQVPDNFFLTCFSCQMQCSHSCRSLEVHIRSLVQQKFAYSNMTILSSKQKRSPSSPMRGSFMDIHPSFKNRFHCSLIASLCSLT